MIFSENRFPLFGIMLWAPRVPSDLAARNRLILVAAVVLAMPFELLARLAVEPLRIGLGNARLGDCLLVHACCWRSGHLIRCRRRVLCESRTGSEGERKNDCRNDSRSRHHIFLPTMWNVVNFESSLCATLSGLYFEQ
jgi:hypothetical protein